MSSAERERRYYCRFCDFACGRGEGIFTNEHGFLCAACYTLWQRGERERIAAIPVPGQSRSVEVPDA